MINLHFILYALLTCTLTCTQISSCSFLSNCLLQFLHKIIIQKKAKIFHSSASPIYPSHIFLNLRCISDTRVGGGLVLNASASQPKGITMRGMPVSFQFIKLYLTKSEFEKKKNYLIT